MTSKGKSAFWPGLAWPGVEAWGGGVPFVQANERVLENWMKMNEAVAGGVFKFSEEMLRFAQARFHEDVEANAALARCRTPKDFFDCQHHFAEKATADYLAAANKMVGMMTEFAREGVDTMCAAGNGSGNRHPAAKP